MVSARCQRFQRPCWGIGIMIESRDEDRELGEQRGTRHASQASHLRVRSFADALLPNELARLAAEDIAEFLVTKRWFGALPIPLL